MTYTITLGGSYMALCEATKRKRIEAKLEEFIKENCVLAIEFLNKYKEPVTDARLLQIQN
jgi:hypothetical protein